MAADDVTGVLPVGSEDLTGSGPAFEGSSAPSWLLASSVQSRGEGGRRHVGLFRHEILAA